MPYGSIGLNKGLRQGKQGLERQQIRRGTRGTGGNRGEEQGGRGKVWW